MNLEHRYRRLLLAYPRSYRERRGEEIIAVLMDDAQPGQSRPDRRAAFDLVLGGVRERLGLHNPDGFLAGAALAAPVCVALAAIDALTTMIEGPRTTSHLVVAYAWLAVAALWAATPRLNTLVVGLAVGATSVATIGLGIESWPAACWGLAAFIGCLSVHAGSVHRQRMVRFGLPILVAILSGLTVWWQVSPPLTDNSVYVGTGQVWIAVMTDLAAISAVVAGVAVAGRRGRVRAIWAALVVLTAWAVSGGAETSYLAAFAMVDRQVVVSGIIATVVAALVIVGAATARGVGGRGLHRAGGITIGYAGSFVALALHDLARGAQYSFWSGEDPVVWHDLTPFWLAALGLLLVPVIADFWVSAAVQRLLVGAAIAGAVGAWVLYPGRPGPLPIVLYVLLLGLCTRGGGHRDRGALLGLGLGVTAMVLVIVSSTIAIDLTSLQWVSSAIAVLVPTSVVVLAAVGFAGRSWWGPSTFAVAALWLAVMGSAQLFPFMVGAAALSLAGLVVARVWSARTRPLGPVT